MSLEAWKPQLDESVLHDTAAAWSSTDNPDRGTAVSHRKLAALTGARGILSAPLRTAAGLPVGHWLFLGSESFVNHPCHVRFIESCSPAVAASLRTLQQSEPGLFRRSAEPMVRAVPLLRGKAVWVLAALLAAAFFIPMHYMVSVECEMRPATRRFVAAPFAGEFTKSLVKPGDLVTRGQVLGRMEGRDVRWELAGLVADQQRARKSHDANMAVGKTAAAQMDQLEVDRLEVKRKLLENRLQQMEIQSPIDGIVVSRDLERSEGVPVTLGQVLLEVAPLDSMFGELAVPDDEIPHVDAGMSATLRLDAYPDVAWTGSVTSILPRSVTREKDNVFLAEVPLDNRDRTLRPGMKGHARICSDRTSLGWIFFHKPWGYVVSWLGW